MASERRKIVPEITEQFGDALDALKKLGVRGSVSFRGFEFKVEEFSSVSIEATMFNSPFVELLGKESRLPVGTPVVTPASFRHFIDEFYSDRKEGVRELLADTIWSAPHLIQREAEKYGLEWDIRKEPFQQGVRGKKIGINPRAVVAVLGEYETFHHIPSRISSDHTRTHLWHNLARRLKEAVEFPESAS